MILKIDNEFNTLPTEEDMYRFNGTVYYRGDDLVSGDHEFNLKYPFFIGSLYDKHNETSQIVITKEEFYHLMLVTGMIEEDGKPTPLAVEYKIASYASFLPDLQYQREMTTSEFIQSFEPIHKYNANQFRKNTETNKLGFEYDVSVTYDLAKRIVKGELNGTKWQAEETMQKLEERYRNYLQLKGVLQ